MLARLSAQLNERNDEVEQLRRTVSQLKNEKSELNRAYEQKLALRQSELQELQAAYNQFEKESDDLLSELSRKNERLIDECRHDNVRSLLK